MRGDISGRCLKEYVLRNSGSWVQDIWRSRVAAADRCPPLLPLRCGFSADFVRKILLGHSLVFARVVPQTFAVLAILSHASTTRSVLRKWEIWSFIVSRPSGCECFCWEVCGLDRGAPAAAPAGGGGCLPIDCCVRGRPLAHSALSCSIDALLDLRVCAGAVEGRLCVFV